jgi:hypothetical protein
MQQLTGVWGLVDTGFQPLLKTNVDFAANLEDWLAETPGLLSSELTIVGRQLELGNERLELLALDGSGCWTVIKIAAGIIDRELLVAALHHVAMLNTLSYDELAAHGDAYLQVHPAGEADSLAALLASLQLSAEQLAQKREIQAFLVGTSKDTRLAPLITYLNGRCQLRLYTAVYTIYTYGASQRLLVREMVDQPDRPAAPIVLPPPARPRRPPPAEPPSPEPEPEPEPDSGLNETVRWVREQTSQVYQRVRETVGLPAANGRTAFEPPDEAEPTLQMADREGIGDLVRQLLTIAAQQGLQARYSASAVQFVLPALPERPLFTARALPRKVGCLPLQLDFAALAEAYDCTPDELEQLFGRSPAQNMAAADLRRLAKALAKLNKKK